MRTFTLAIAGSLFFTPALSHTLVSKEKPTGHLDIGTFKREAPQDMQIMQLFLPLGSTQRKNDLWFLDLRTQDREGRAFEGNIGIGHRILKKAHEVGHYAYWDKRKTFAGNTFKQLVLGGEYQTQHTGWYGNAYLPLGKTKALGNTGMAELRENGGFHNVWFANGHEHMLTGADLEYGWDVKPDCRLYLGGYGFHKSGIRTAIGPRVSLRWRPFHTGRLSNITFDGLWRYDRLQRHTWHLGMNYRVWLGERPKSQWSNLLVDTVRRDLDIVTRNQLTDYQPLKRGDGQAFKIKKVTTESDLSASGADVFYLENDVELSSTFTLADGKTLAGSGYAFEGNHQEIHLGSGNTRLYSNADIDLVTLTGTSSVQHLTLNTKPNSNHFALKTSGTFHATVHDITTNGRLSFAATAGNNDLTFHDNVVNFDPTSAPFGSAVLDIETPGAGSQLTVHNFAHNTLATTATIDVWRNDANGNNSVIVYEDNATYNTIGAVSLTGLENKTSGDNATIDFAGAVSHNTFKGFVYNETPGANSTITFSHFDRNEIGNAFNNLACNGGNISFVETFNNNAFTGSVASQFINHATTSSSMTFGEVAHNTFPKGGFPRTWVNIADRSSSIQFLGAVHHNSFTQILSHSSLNIGIDNAVDGSGDSIQYAKPVANNTFRNASATGTFTAIRTETGVTFAGGFQNNTFKGKQPGDVFLTTV